MSNTLNNQTSKDVLMMTEDRLDDVSDFLYHHGIKNQKWGNRRYQYNDGSLTPLGRIHYGVGEARKAIKSVVNPTTEDLQRKLDKANAKKQKAELKSQIKAAKQQTKDIKNNIKKKDTVRQMSDEELMNAINRYRNERTLKALQNEASKSQGRRFIEEQIERGVAEAIGTTTKNTLINVGKTISDSFDTEENKLNRQVRIQENKNKLSGNNSKSDALKKAAEDSENARRSYKNKLEVDAMKGNEKAKQALNDMSNINKGKYESPNKETKKQENDKTKKDKTDTKNKNVANALWYPIDKDSKSKSKSRK